jgi:membrane fusion protein (multidrug efflux system)
MSGLFRDEAIARHANHRDGGAVLDLSPSWIRWTYPLLVAVVALGAAWSLIGRVHEYASGPAIVRVADRGDVTAKLAGNVAEVLVRRGQRVAAGDPLLRFFSEEEDAELRRLQDEFEAQLIKVLHEPTDAASRQTLGGLRAQRDLAAKRVAERLVRAPRAGIVGDVRVRPGQHVAGGDHLVTVLRENAALVMVALLPGRYRPMLQPGMTMRFELVGYPYEYRSLVIETVDDEVVGPAEARRVLGSEVADGVELREPVVLVRASLRDREFVSHGRRFRYYDGLPARAQIAIRTESLLMRVLPMLKELGDAS